VSLIKLSIVSQTSQVFPQGKAYFCLVAALLGWLTFFIGFSRRWGNRKWARRSRGHNGPETGPKSLYGSAKYESLQSGCQTRLSCVAKREPPNNPLVEEQPEGRRAGG